MDKATLIFFEDVLMSDSTSLMQTTQTHVDVDDENLKRAINVKIEAIKGDLVNIQHLLET